MHAIYAYYLALNCTHHTTLGAAAVCRKCSHAACTLYWLMPRPQRAFAVFFFLCRRKPGIIMLAHKKNVIASLLKVIENLGLLFVCSKKVSERSEKQKANEFLSLAWKPICREPLCSLSQQGHAQVCHQEIKLYCAYPGCQRHCSLSSANARCGIKKTVFCNQDL